jgi:acyl dehydratase
MSKIDRFNVGQQASLTRTFSQEVVKAFSLLTGDDNPIHLDADYAATTLFERPISQGMLSASLISAVLGTQLPGSGTIYLQQTLSFKRPVFVGETLTAVVTVTGIRPEKNLISLLTQCFNAQQEVVIDGMALVKLS